ncbi:MAG: hypothetical protein COB93_08430 [Sneathiella sp.]|nr:MAG: hypothetical protein COB93_08430 [Sneathiella sp.]
MYMGKLQWVDAFELGMPEIDDDHRALLGILNKMQTAVDSGDFDLYLFLIDELIATSIAHFQYEEALLDKIGYPDVDRHRDHHAMLLRRAMAVKEASQKITTKEGLTGCCDEMFKFLVDDIVAGDTNFKSFLEEKGLIARS